MESPGKVKNLSQYLGKGYKVLATAGHVRSLPRKKGSVAPHQDFALTWELLEKAQRPLGAIEKAVKEADVLILATDLDREGEAISWHLLEHLKQKNLLKKDLIVERVSFNAVTKSAVLEAIKNPRPLDQNLIDAYLARLSLDYLVGFNLSPVLWRKLPGSRSAGRVQSVALRLVVEKEKAIKSFVSKEYWSIHGIFVHTTPFEAHLSVFEGQKLDKMSIVDEAQAQAYVKRAQQETYHIARVQSKPVQRHPQPPFITSSLQQEASRKLGFSPVRAMHIAQKLYEGVEFNGQTLGLITYMRTDSSFIVPEIIEAVRDLIRKTWGDKYVANKVRVYKKKANSQEAHEAIRPTDVNLTPAELKQSLAEEEWLLYKLIWDRTIASQMSSVQSAQTTVILNNKDASLAFRATGTVLTFDGFLVLYEESSNEEATDAKIVVLPILQEGHDVRLESLRTNQHFTQPPARYSEASLVKELEDLGIGRPSTYARILQVLQERSYVVIERKKLVATELGSVVTAFLCKFFAQYVNHNFTADLERKLDDVSAGKQPWKDLLNTFWPEFNEAVEKSQGLKIQDVLEHITKDVLGEEVRPCPKCQKGSLVLKMSKMGPFLACSTYPECTYNENVDSSEDAGQPQNMNLGTHPVTGHEVYLKKGPYGWYVSHDTSRVGLGTLFSPETLTLSQAVFLLTMPKNLGLHPETQKEVLLGLGRFGPYLKYDGRFISVKTKDLDAITLEQAVNLIATSKKVESVPKKDKPLVEAKKETPIVEAKKNKPAAEAKKVEPKKTPKTKPPKETPDRVNEEKLAIKPRLI